MVDKAEVGNLLKGIMKNLDEFIRRIEANVDVS
jgi:hypothetical protein